MLLRLWKIICGPGTSQGIIRELFLEPWMMGPYIAYRAWTNNYPKII